MPHQTVCGFCQWPFNISHHQCRRPPTESDDRDVRTRKLAEAPATYIELCFVPVLLATLRHPHRMDLSVGDDHPRLAFELCRRLPGD